MEILEQNDPKWKNAFGRGTTSNRTPDIEFKARAHNLWVGVSGVMLCGETYESCNSMYVLYRSFISLIQIPTLKHRYPEHLSVLLQHPHVSYCAGTNLQVMVFLCWIISYIGRERAGRVWTGWRRFRIVPESSCAY